MFAWLFRWLIVRPLAAVVIAFSRPVPGGKPAVVHLRIAGRLAEASPRALPFVPSQVSLVHDVVGALRAIAREPRVVGVRIELGRIEAGVARVQELRRALVAVRAAGKYVHVHLDGGGLREYLVACTADRITAPPMGTLDLVGLRGETTYYGGVASSLGVHADFEAVGDYKAFAERFVRSGPTSAARRNTEAIFGDVWAQAVAAVAGARGLSREDAAARLGRGPYGVDEAIEAGLIDAAVYPDGVRRLIRKAVGKHRQLKGGRYWARRRRVTRWRQRARRTPVVAVVPAVGQVMPGAAANLPANVIAARTLVRQLNAVRKDDQVAAVVLRIDSPGGSAEASDLIWRAVKRLGERKPVVASMGDVAASGGYYIAMGAHRVLAQPATLTGSIGVVAGKLNLGGLYERLGVHRDVIQIGDHAGFYSSFEDFNEAERARLRERMDAFYGAFVGRAASDRGMEEQALERHARGRVWTGRQALAHGLIDGLGGLYDAVVAASELAGAPGTLAMAEVVSHPMPLWWPGRWAGAARAWLAERAPAADVLLSPELRHGGLLARLPFDIRFLG